MSKEKQTKKLNNIKVIFTLIVISILVICLIYNVIALFVNPTETFMIENGKISSSEETECYIVREETLFQGDNYKNGISQIKTEGQRVAKGEPIFRYYTNNEQNLIRKIAELDSQIQEAMEGEKNIYSSDIAILEKQIDENLLKVANTNKLSDIKEYKKIIDNALTKKAKLIGELSPSGSYIKKLVSQRTKYEEKLNSGSEYVKATISGTVSYKIDGLEETLTPQAIEEFTTDYLNSLKLKTGEIIPSSEEKGKIVNNYNCYLVVILNSDEAQKAEVDNSVEVTLPTGDTVRATIEFISEQENNKRLFKLKIDKCVEKLIDYRKISIKITWWSASGLKVPNSSILKEDDKTYIIRKRAGYSDKIMIKILKESKNYSIIDNYSTLELKEMGYSVEEITNMKNISLYDEIKRNAT